MKYIVEQLALINVEVEADSPNQALEIVHNTEYAIDVTYTNLETSWSWSESHPVLVTDTQGIIVLTAE